MLNENIKILRKKKGLSQEELANRLHVVRQTISKWEQGLSVPDAEMLGRIAGELDTTTAVLLGEQVGEGEADDPLQDVAAQLAQLNEQYILMQCKRRKRWRILCRVLLIVAGIGLLSSAASLIYGWCANANLSANSAIIGGADGATHIYLTNVAPQGLILVIALAVGSFAVIGLKKSRN